MFCDWLNVWQQFPARDYPNYLGGRVISIEGQCDFGRIQVVDDSGEISHAWAFSGSDDVGYSVAKFGHHRGSFETSIMIRMINGRLEVRGNPSAYGRLDNLFGVSVDEGIMIFNHVLCGLGLPQFTTGRVSKIWLQKEQRFEESFSGAHLTRVDLTVNQSVGMGKVRDYNKWLAGQKLSRSSPCDDDLEKFARWDYSTVYTSSSKYWVNCKHYDKSLAIEELTLPHYIKNLRCAVREGRISDVESKRLTVEAEAYLGRLAAWCAEVGVVRSEWSLRSRWFQQNLGRGWWCPGETQAGLMGIIDTERGKIMNRAVVYDDNLDNLTSSEFRAFDRWKKGNPLCVSDGGSMSKPTFYRLRSSILRKTGFDISARPLTSSPSSDLRPVYFAVKPLSVSDAPDWYVRPDFLLAA